MWILTRKGSSRGMSNEREPIRKVVSWLSSFHKAQVLLLPRQKKARALSEPGEPFQANVHLVARPVGRFDPSGHFLAREVILPDHASPSRFHTQGTSTLPTGIGATFSVS